MEIKELKTYSSYNLHVNGLMAELLQEQNDEILEQNIESSFPSIIKTIAHIWDAEHIWLRRLKGETIGGFPSHNFVGSPQEIIDKLMTTSYDFNDFVQAQDESSLKELLPIRTTKGHDFEQSRYQMIHHCINHSTQHRGQLITMCRQVGIKNFKALDYIWYLRNMGL